MALAEMHLSLSGTMDMNAAEVLAIAYLGMHGQLGPTDLAQRLHLRSGAITALLDRLEERGFVERHPHPGDRRRVIVRLTQRGRREPMQELGPMVDRIMALVERLSVRDRQVVSRFLDDLVRVIGERSPAVSTEK